MDKNYKICCFTGHRPSGFIWDYYDKNFEYHKEYLRVLEYEIEQRIKEGFDYFICGGAIGADMDFADTVIRWREKYSHIKLEIAIPCANQNLKWSETEKQRYREILDKADSIKVLLQNYTRYCMHQRNRYMVDKSEYIIAVWNGSERGGTYYTIQYAKRKGKQIEYIGIPALTIKERNKNTDYYLEFCTTVKERKNRKRLWQELEKRMQGEE